MSADEQPSPFGDASWFDDQFGRDVPEPARGLPPPLRHALVLIGVAAVVAAAALAAGLTHDRHRGDSSPATSTPAEVSSLRVVPPMAGVAVEVNGHRYTSRSDGSIPLDAADRHGRAAIIEPQDISPAVRVAFSAWVDGTTVSARSLDHLRGPTVEIGFVVSNRVELTADAARSGRGLVPVERRQRHHHDRCHRLRTGDTSRQHRRRDDRRADHLHGRDRRRSSRDVRPRT